MSIKEGMGWLAGQVALITGGASGLDRALIESFLRGGARVGVLHSAIVLGLKKRIVKEKSCYI